MLPIYVDIDDVLAESTRAYVDIVKQLFGREVSYEKITTFDLKVSFDFTQAEFDHFFDAVHQSDAILSFEPIAGAVDVLSDWADRGFEISVVTGRLASSYDASLEWLTMHEVPFHSLTMVDKYSRPNNDKGCAISLSRLSQMKFSMAIEDSLEMATFLSQEMGIPVLLFDRPWNQAVGLDRMIQRCESWMHVSETGPRFSEYGSSPKELSNPIGFKGSRVQGVE